MFKLCDRVDAVLNGEVNPTVWDFILIGLNTLFILAALIGTIWLAAFVVEIYR